MDKNNCTQATNGMWTCEGDFMYSALVEYKKRMGIPIDQPIADNFHELIEKTREVFFELNTDSSIDYTFYGYRNRKPGRVRKYQDSAERSRAWRERNNGKKKEDFTR